MKGIVYCIECKDTGGKYIGSTTKKLNWRMLKHKSDVNQYDKGNTNKKCTVYYIIKNGNYKSYILEEVEYEVVKDLRKKELEYIEKTDCVNIVHPTISKPESDRRYYKDNKEKILQERKDYNEKNKEKILQNKKDYRKENKEKISQQNKDYNEKNKEKIKERKSKVIECECGVSYTFGHKARHFNSARHINYI
tara:strand:- start:33 stop:611 length:579 start_codon:yes stop_codon:yes gene_type:complete